MPLDDPISPGQEIAPGVRIDPGLLKFAASRSSGPGGQNVNKVSTRIELRVALSDLPIPPTARTRLKRLAGRRVTAEGDLLIASDEHRSQVRNRAECLDRLRDLVIRALTPPKPRRPTKPTKGSKERRLKGKRERSEVKKRRSSKGERPSEGGW